MNEQVKIRMNKAMHYMMLSCDTATFLMTKREYQKLKCKDNLQLNLHLLGCKFCRAFNKQNTILTEKMQMIRENPPMEKLSDKKKIEIEESLRNTI